MVNPEKGTTKGGSTGWESIEGEADKFDAQVAREAVMAQRELEKKRQELSGIEGEIDARKRPSGEFYDGGNLDATEASHGTSKLETEATAVRREISEARRISDALSTEAGRKAAAEQLRQEAKEREDRERHFQRGLTSADVAELDRLDQRIAEAEVSNPNAKSKLEEAREKLVETIVSRGRVMEEAAATHTAANAETEAAAPEETSADAEQANTDAAATSTEDTNNKNKAMAFAEKIDAEKVTSSARKESFTVKRLLKHMAEYDVGAKHSIFERRQHEKEMAELKRYGYSTSDRSSRIFDTLSRVDTGSVIGAKELEEIGRDRARDFKMIELSLNGADGKEIRKILKKHGFSKIPKSWDDDGFTADEMHRMAFHVSFS